ncbi:MAG: hypothetical protein HYY20_07785 [Candidatus Tectomicrobia bacterium]|uniref:Quinol:cytochrome C oxidoreductase n=1 Tax=Tectimicrobiota bacterium TaxID=2528274 RepID=A0A932CP91_UNCTE|nr:hypothetical protein [Candidatus Tectomicrobia bacterium]
MNQTEALQPRLDRLQRGSLIAGIVGLVLCVIGAFLSRQQFFQSYLFAYLFWTGLALGSLAVLMLHTLVGGSWGVPIRHLLESGSRLLPLMALLFVPLLFGLQDLYSWARPEVAAQERLVQAKLPYLSVPFFLARTVLYFAIWIGLALLLNRWLHAQERTEAPLPERRLQGLSAIGLVLYVLTMTFAAIDWVMSLEPLWFSTIFGLLFVVGQGLVTFAFAIVALVLLVRGTSLEPWVGTTPLHDLGNLLLAFVTFWLYLSFSQFLIIWSGNLPEESFWYMYRIQGGWEAIIIAVIVLQFALPFFLLLFRFVKRRGPFLAGVAATILGMRLIDLFWLVAPTFHREGLYVHWLDLAAPIGIGGIWMAVFTWYLKGRPLLPLHDPRLPEVARHG